MTEVMSRPLDLTDVFTTESLPSIPYEQESAVQEVEQIPVRGDISSESLVNQAARRSDNRHQQQEFDRMTASNPFVSDVFKSEIYLQNNGYLKRFLPTVVSYVGGDKE